MQMTVSPSGSSQTPRLFAGKEETTGAKVPDMAHLASIKSHCWYCNKPLYNHRNFCGTECREAMYEDNERARQRRMILGCQC